MINPQRIEYNTFSSEDFDLITCLSFDSDSGENSSFLSRDAVASETYRGAIKHVSSYKYTDVLAPTLTFIDKNFEDFDLDRQRQVMKWLTSKDTPSFLTVYHDDSNVIAYEILGAFTEISTYKLGNGRVVGFQCVFTSISPFAFSALHTVTQTITNSTNNKITINIDTDDNKPVYPRVIVQHNGSVVNIPTGTVLTYMSDMVENTAYFNDTTYYWKSASKISGTTKPDYDWETVMVDHAYTDADTWKDKTIYYYEATQTYYWVEPYYFHESRTNPNLATTSIRFTNKHTDFLNQSTVLEQTIVKNNNTTELVIIDGANRIISSNSANRMFDDNFNWAWMPLLDGKNEIMIEGNCTVTISYREPRKIGEY